MNRTVYNFYIYLKIGLKLNGFCVARFVGYSIWCTCGIWLLLCCFYVICLWLNFGSIYMWGFLSFWGGWGGGRSRPRPEHVVIVGHLSVDPIGLFLLLVDVTVFLLLFFCISLSIMINYLYFISIILMKQSLIPF